MPSWKKLALLGLITGSVDPLSLQADLVEENINHEAENIGYHLMTKQELFQHLNQKTRELFDALPEEGQQLALQVASARCNQTNLCHSLNACKTDKNACAGQGSCKGTGKCAFSNKNLAVKLVAKKLEKERKKLLEE